MVRVKSIYVLLSHLVAATLWNYQILLLVHGQVNAKNMTPFMINLLMQTDTKITRYYVLSPYTFYFSHLVAATLWNYQILLLVHGQVNAKIHVFN